MTTIIAAICVGLREYGPIPEGMHIGHVCHDVDPTCPGGAECPHRACVNIHHLKVQTPKENAQAVRDRVPRTHCKRGHPRTEENTYVAPDGYPQCRECRRLLNRRATP